MMQGDAYGIPIEILHSDGSVVTPDDVDNVEVVIGTIKKTYAKEELTYDYGQWICHVKQEETFNLPSNYVSAQVRVLFKNGSTEGVSLGKIYVNESMSKVVLE